MIRSDRPVELVQKAIQSTVSHLRRRTKTACALSQGQMQTLSRHSRWQIEAHTIGGRKIDEGTKQAARSDLGISIADRCVGVWARDSRIAA